VDMNFGLRVKGRSIKMCIHRPTHSRSLRFQGVRLHLNFLPVVMYWNTVNLKVAVSTSPRRMGRRSKGVWVSSEENRMTSAMAFGRGGRPRFPHIIINHVRGNKEKRYLIPRLTLSVRVLLRS